MNADHCSTVAQDRGNGARRRQGAEKIAAEKARAGLRHVVVCLNVTGSSKEDSQACSCWFDHHS